MNEPTEEQGAVAVALTPTPPSAPAPPPTSPLTLPKRPTSTASLAINPAQAAAETLAAILGHPLTVETASQMSDANADLLDFRPESLMQTLARQLVVLQALSMQLTKQGMEAAKYPQAQASLLRTALTAQKEARCVIELMRELQREAEKREAETVDG